MRTFLLCCIFLGLGIHGMAQNGLEQKTVHILPNSELTITGDTNISSFTCNFDPSYLEESRKIEFRESDNHISFKNAVLQLKNDGFDCGSKAINRDFHTLLKTSQYPYINLELTEIHLYDEQSANAYVKITIAGKTKNYTLPVTIARSPTSCFSGKLKLDITDFDLEAPKKMFGLIVIRKEIEIDFNLAVKY